jgi:hypothetical protein
VFAKALQLSTQDTELTVRLATEIEAGVYTQNQGNEGKYKTKARGIHSNLKDAKNSELRENILNGAIDPSQLATMSYEEMAHPTAKLQRQESEQRLLEARRSDWIQSNQKQDIDSIIECRR